MAEYLRFVPDPKIYPEAYLSFQELISAGQVLAPAFLGLMLTHARDYLIATPGEHQYRRNYLVPKWLNFWVKKMEDLEDTTSHNKKRLIIHPNIVSLSQMSDIFQSADGLTGVWNMATGEGTPAQRLIWSRSMRQTVRVGLLYESQKYFTDHPDRRLPCLPEAMRASMAAHFGLLVSTAPDKSDNLSESKHYAGVFKLSGSDINFVTVENANWRDVLARNPQNLRGQALISTIVFHASDSTELLAPPTLDLDEVVTSVHASDLTEKLNESHHKLVLSRLPRPEKYRPLLIADIVIK
jgi:hypothetical protein